MDAHILWYNYNADLCSAEMTHHFHSHCFSKLPHSGGTCVSTFCTDIPFDAVPTDAAGFHIENEAQIPPPQSYIFHISVSPAFTTSASAPHAPFSAASRHQQTGRGRRLKITTPCAGWRWSSNCAIAHTSSRICTVSFSGSGGVFPLHKLPLVNLHGQLVYLDNRKQIRCSL